MGHRGRFPARVPTVMIADVSCPGEITLKSTCACINGTLVIVVVLTLWTNFTSIRNKEFVLGKYFVFQFVVITK